jgi:hypothetical protein
VFFEGRARLYFQVSEGAMPRHSIRLRAKEFFMADKSNLFMFRSETSTALHGFAMESAGAKLPQKFGPWAGIGVLRPDQVPPHGMRREAIESGIAENGYQLWRKKTP